jgi:hypothetical protein
VRHRRTTSHVRGGTLALLEDEFSSIDGAEHTLDLLWVQDFRNPSGDGEPGHQFPWVGDAYATGAAGQEVAAPPGPGPAAAYVKTDVAKPDGDFRWAQGVFMFEPPTGALRYVNPYRLLVPMQRTIPAGGSVRIRHAFAIAPARADLAAVAADVTDLYTPPTVGFTAPDEGATSAQPTVDVRGTARDDRGTPAVTLNGDPVAVAPDGTWTGRVTLTPGENTVTARARDAAGNEATKTHTVTVVDETAPEVTIESPADGAVYGRGEVVLADYSCADEANGSGLASCAGNVADGSAVDTSSLGEHTFTVNAADSAGNESSESVTYTVVDETAPAISLVMSPRQYT